MNDALIAPIPVFQELNIEGKKKRRLFRHWGEIRVIDMDGRIKVLRESGYERAYPQTYKKVSRIKQEEKTT